MTKQTPTLLPRFPDDAELCVDTASGAEMWSGKEWNDYMAAAERNQSLVTIRLISIEKPGREYADRVPAPRPVPTTAARLADARACGHTPEQHRHDDGQDADARSHDRAMRELTAERDRFARDHASAEQVATFRQGVIDLHRQELGAAGEVIAVVRDAQEQIERALARYDTQPEPASVEPAATLRSESGCMGDPDTELRLAGVHPDQDPAGAEQVLRDRIEHAIRARLVKAWPALADEAWISQAAAMGATAAVNELTAAEQG